MSDPRYACALCGTWVCDACGGRRTNTDIRYCTYPCSQCRGREGVLIPTMHTERMWNSHNEGELPKPYPYGERPGEEEWGNGFGHRTVPRPTYRGVPYPEYPCEMESWMRGVDAALKRTEEA